jgi:hypothetical protein
VLSFLKKRNPPPVDNDEVATSEQEAVVAKGESASIIDAYVMGFPTAQKAVDLFKGEWSSKLPDELGVESGTAGLFGDARIIQMVEALGGIEGASVLELGPLEGAHTTMVERAGAASVVAVEANSRAYLKCLIVKEVLGLTKSRFLLGDINAFMDETPDRFDICVASGVLYHQTDPFETLRLIGKVADTVLLWTHYYDADLVNKLTDIADHFTAEPIVRDTGSMEVRYYPRDYREALEWTGFCGAGVERTYWMTRDDIMSCLEQLGFSRLDVLNENLEHRHGPCFTVLGRKN